jgi:hypothetical protein
MKGLFYILACVLACILACASVSAQECKNGVCKVERKVERTSNVSIATPVKFAAHHVVYRRSGERRFFMRLFCR